MIYFLKRLFRPLVNAVALTKIKKFVENDFDDMIKYANWQKGEKLKKLINKII